MTRPEGRWIPDGRAKAIRADCEASLAALDGLPIDLYLIHAPDPRTPWRTSVRALARLVDEGLVEKRSGSRTSTGTSWTRRSSSRPIAAVQVGLSVLDDQALRGGVVERCEEAGVTVIAHSPLGGPTPGRRPRAPAAARGDRRGARARRPAEVALAWLLHLSPTLVAIPGARRPDGRALRRPRGDARARASEVAALSGERRTTTRRARPPERTPTSSS